MSYPHFFSRVPKLQIIIPLLASVLLSGFIYLVFRPESLSVLRSSGSSLFWDIVETILIVLVASAPLFYGWITRRPYESAVFGMFLTTFLYVPGFIDVVHYLGIKEVLLGLGRYVPSVLCSVGAGYLAARGSLRELIIGALFVVLWLFILISGLN